MTTMADHLRDRMSDQGPLTVAQFMEDALTHPRLGYYMGRDPFGRGGDFITAPEISQMFGELIGLWCVIQWQAMGSPAPVNLVELGPGRGTMMADVLRAGRGAEGFLESLDVSLVEISPSLKVLQEETLVKTPAIHAARSLGWWSDFSEIPEGPLLAVANEFIDALPVHQFQMTPDGWRERLVGPGEGGFRFVLADGPPAEGVIPPAVDNAGENAPEGAIAEVRPRATTLARAMAGRLTRNPGAVLIIDYGHEKSAAGDTLQAVKGHEYQDPFKDPGEADLTAHVDFAEFGRAAEEAGARVLGPVNQGAFLLELGLEARAQAMAGRLTRNPGAVLIIDYGHGESAAGDTLQAVKGHEYQDPLLGPGEADLTAHVDFAEFGRAAEEAGARVLGPVTQGAFLLELGLEARAQALMTASPDHQREIDQAFQRLTSDDGMGRLFKVLVLTSPDMPPPPGFQ